MQIIVFWIFVLGSVHDALHDARVFAYSPLYTNITEKELLPNKTVTVNGIELPLYL